MRSQKWDRAAFRPPKSRWTLHARIAYRDYWETVSPKGFSRFVKGSIVIQRCRSGQAASTNDKMKSLEVRHIGEFGETERSLTSVGT